MAENTNALRQLQPGQRCEVWIASAATGARNLVYLSANDGHIYRADLAGGPATLITAEDGFFHFLHGVSPDGERLAYVGIKASDFTRPNFTQPGRLLTLPA